MFTIPAKLVLIWNLAQALGLDTSRWKQGTKLETTKSLSWAEMFGRAGHTSFHSRSPRQSHLKRWSLLMNAREWIDVCTIDKIFLV